jgi:hypothetical protein
MKTFLGFTPRQDNLDEQKFEDVSLPLKVMTACFYKHLRKSTSSTIQFLGSPH